MKKTRLYLGLTAWLIAIMLMTVACDNDLEINQQYDFDLVTMPVQKKIAKGETAEIRCSLIKQGDYKPNQYKIRYFQSDGSGELRLDNGTILQPNDLYPLPETIFRLYYTSACTDQQTLNIFVEDSFGQVVTKSFSFQNEAVIEQNKP